MHLALCRLIVRDLAAGSLVLLFYHGLSTGQNRTSLPLGEDLQSADLLMTFGFSLM